MPVSSSELKLPGHHFVIENSQGKVTVRVNNEALIALGATPDEESLATTLERHMPLTVDTLKENIQWMRPRTP